MTQSTPAPDSTATAHPPQSLWRELRPATAACVKPSIARDDAGWSARVLDDGTYTLDNNPIQNALRPIAIGCKN